jgi:DNA-binding CsgD family transcriptional regulator
MLVGRELESARVDSLLAQAREGASAVLFLRGEAGIGKSALCHYAIEHADRMVVLASCGVEAEAELPYAALGDLLGPVLDRLGAIPKPQAAALAGALAIGPAAPAERFTMAAATLSLLAAAAEEAPLLAVVDDAHWLDRPSAQALAFAGRRLGAEGIVLLVTARSEHDCPLDLPQPAELSLSGLDLAGSKALLAQTAPVRVASAVAERLHRATAGNPLALTEACGLFSDQQLSGSAPFDEPVPAGPSLEPAFLRHVSGLPRDTRRALVVAAAGESDAIAAVTAATAALALDPAALERAESAGLVMMTDGSLEFRHPLVRSAIYHNASGAERRAAHRALAEVLAGDGSSERRAWHLAAATLAPDEGVAAELEQAALNARGRRGHASAASAFERAARLTPDDEPRARRLLEAASDQQLAGSPEAAGALLERALGCTEDPLLRARIQQLRGRVELWSGRLSSAHELLVREASLVEDHDSSQAALMLAEACVPCLLVGDCGLALETARRASALAQRAGGVAEIVSAIVLGEGLILSGESQAGRSLICRNFEVLEASDPLAGLHELLGTAAMGLIYTEEYVLARRLLDSAVGGARDASAPGVLPWLLACRSQLDYRTGRWQQAYAEAFEAAELAVETDQGAMVPPALASAALIEAAHGKEADCRLHCLEVIEFGQAHGVATWQTNGNVVLGLLELGLGRAAEAVDRLEPVAAFAREHGVEEPAGFRWAPDLIEAYVHTGRRADAAAELVTLERQAARTEGTWAQATAARCRGLLAEEEAFDECFSEAMRWHERTPTPFERARTQLCHGERLRRANRRVEAREQLRRALSSFESLGAAPWADRARAELRASGETARRRDPTSRERLTPRELQVGLVVADGATNREVAAALFLTPKTIEFHLSHIYAKLGIRSRSELARLFAAEAAEQVQGGLGERTAAASEVR